jgi:5-(carboxyamino)imidazole ribonucleotide mutase
VATVSIGGARNAGLLAARILASATDEQAEALRGRLATFADDLRQLALDKGARLRDRDA